MDDGKIGETDLPALQDGLQRRRGDLRLQQVAALQPALRPHEGVPDAPVQRDALLLRRHHPRADLLDQARLPQEQGRPAASRSTASTCGSPTTRSATCSASAATRSGAWAAGGAARCRQQGHLLHRELHREAHLLAGAQARRSLGLGEGPTPEVLDTGIKDFGATFPQPHPRLPRGRDQRRAARAPARLRAATRWRRWSTSGR